MYELPGGGALISPSDQAWFDGCQRRTALTGCLIELAGSLVLMLRYAPPLSVIGRGTKIRDYERADYERNRAHQRGSKQVRIEPRTNEFSCSRIPPLPSVHDSRPYT